MIKFLIIFLTIYDPSSAGITDYPQLVKLFFADGKLPVRVRNLKNYVKRIKANESVVLDFIGLVEQFKGYTANEYTVTTNDGYHLKIHRISESPKSRKAQGKPVVFLQHGIGGSSDFFVLFGPGQALAFQLADAGYDVWIGNVRGNTYCRSHEKYDPKDSQFWEFSLDEIANYDMSRSIDYILTKTQKKSLTFLGYSMGTTLSYMLLSSKPEYNKKINLLINVAPIVYFVQPADMLLDLMITSILWLHTSAVKVLKTKSTNEVLPQSAILEQFSRELCSGTGFNFCKMGLGMVTDVANLDPKIIPKILAHIPAGISYNTLKHYQQLLKSNGRFQKYDYNSCGWFDLVCPTNGTTNEEKYNQATPPEYDLSLVTTRNVIYYSLTDTVALSKDVEYLSQKLPNVINMEEIAGEKTFNHLDFFWHKDARSKIYNRMLQIIRSKRCGK